MLSGVSGTPARGAPGDALPSSKPGAPELGGTSTDARFSPGWAKHIASVLAAMTLAVSEPQGQEQLEGTHEPPALPAVTTLPPATAEPANTQEQAVGHWGYGDHSGPVFVAGGEPGPTGPSFDTISLDGCAANNEGTDPRQPPSHASLVMQGGSVPFSVAQLPLPFRGGTGSLDWFPGGGDGLFEPDPQRPWLPPPLFGAEVALRQATRVQREETATLRAALHRRSQDMGMRQNALHRPRSASSGAVRGPPGQRGRAAAVGASSEGSASSAKQRRGFGADPDGWSGGREPAAAGVMEECTLPPREDRPPWEAVSRDTLAAAAATIPTVAPPPAAFGMAPPLPAPFVPQRSAPPVAIPSSLFGGGGRFDPFRGVEAPCYSNFPDNRGGSQHCPSVRPVPPRPTTAPPPLAEHLAGQQRVLLGVLQRLLEQQRGQQRLLERQQWRRHREQAQQLKQLATALQLALQPRVQEAVCNACQSPTLKLLPSYGSPTATWRRRSRSRSRSPRAESPQPGRTPRPWCFACSRQPTAAPLTRKGKRGRSQSRSPLGCACCRAAHSVPRVVVYRDSPTQTRPPDVDSEDADSSPRPLPLEPREMGAVGEDAPGNPQVDLVERCDSLCRAIQRQLLGLKGGLGASPSTGGTVPTPFLAPCTSCAVDVPEARAEAVPHLAERLPEAHHGPQTHPFLWHLFSNIGEVTCSEHSQPNSRSAELFTPVLSSILSDTCSRAPAVGRDLHRFSVHDVDEGHSPVRQAEFRALCHLLDGAQELRHRQQQLLTFLRDTLGLDAAAAAVDGPGPSEGGTRPQ